MPTKSCRDQRSSLVPVGGIGIYPLNCQQLLHNPRMTSSGGLQ
jgi:hypothetical protein